MIPNNNGAGQRGENKPEVVVLSSSDDENGRVELVRRPPIDFGSDNSLDEDMKGCWGLL